MKAQLAQARLSAMDYAEHLLSRASNSAIDGNRRGEGNKNGAGSDAKESQSFLSSEATSSTPPHLLEHDVDTRKENLINRFDLIAHSVFEKPVYHDVVDSGEDALFATEPSTTEPTVSKSEIERRGILMDPRATLRLTLASDCSVLDVKVDAVGKYLEVTYEYDALVNYVSRWVLEAIMQGNIGVAEKIIRSSYFNRCLRHLTLCTSLQDQYSEASKSFGVEGAKPHSWAIPDLAIPADFGAIHARLKALEQDLVTLSRIETQKLGILSLWKGSGWMTMNARGPLLTFFALPLRLGAVSSLLSSPSGVLEAYPSVATSEDGDPVLLKRNSEPIQKVLSRASEEHLSLLNDLPPLDSTKFTEFQTLPAYTSNALAPLILARLREQCTLCTHHLGPTDTTKEKEEDTSEPFKMKDLDALAFHIEIEQGRVIDPNTLRPIMCAPRSNSSAIAFFSPPQAHITSAQVGTSSALPEEELTHFLRALTPSVDSSYEDPSQFMDLGVQWAPFGQPDLPEDVHLPLCLTLRLEQDIPFYSSLFHRLRALAVSADPTSLLRTYFATDEANRTGNAPPAGAEPSKPKKITFRTSKSAAPIVPAASPVAAHLPTSTPLYGTTLACLFTKKENGNEPQTEDVVLPFSVPSSTAPASDSGLHVRCLHTHHTTSTPAALMVRSVNFVDSRHIRALVAVLRQQAVINAIFASCFLDDQAMTWSAFLLQGLMKESASHSADPLRSSSGVSGKPSSGMLANIPLNSSFELASPPRTRQKRPRMDSSTEILASPEPMRRIALDDWQTDSKLKMEALCPLNIELAALMEPYFGWSVMVKHSPLADANRVAAPPSLFSFAVHVATDGYIHVVPADMAHVTNEQRSCKRLENLLRATFNLPLSLQLWMKGSL